MYILSFTVDQPYPMPVFILAFAAVLLLVVIILLVAFNLIEGLSLRLARDDVHYQWFNVRTLVQNFKLLFVEF